MKLSLNKAAKEFGIGKSTISKAISDGKLSAEKNDAGGYRIDPAEMLRVFGDLIEQRRRGRSRTTDEPSDIVTADGVPVRSSSSEPNGVLELRVQLAEAVAKWQAAERMLDQANSRGDREQENADHWREQAENSLRLLSDLREQVERSEPQSAPGLFARLFGRKVA